MEPRLGAHLPFWIAAAALAAVGCTSKAPPPPPPAVPEPRPAVVTSNVERRDYAGSASCAPCHDAIYAKWERSPMHRMTRLEGTEGVSRAPFDGATFVFKGDRVTPFEQDGRRYMRVVSEANGEQLFRVTRVIGGRYREDFTGREVATPLADSPPTGEVEEPVLPVSWLLFSKTWRYKGYSVMVKERPRLGKHGAPWRETCIFCHNTAPYLATVYDDLDAGAGVYQGSVSDRLLPASRLWRTGAANDAELGRALRDEIAFLGGTVEDAHAGARALADAAARATRDRFGQAQLVEVGIGCEACHNGARQHVDDPTKKPTFVPTGAGLRNVMKSTEPTRAAWINHTCARCHTVLFSRYPYTWEGGGRAHNPGGSTINSGEARDFLLGGCAGAMACTTCHDPHGEDRRGDLDRLGTVAGNGVCTACHAAYGAPGALQAHTHHAPDGEGSACLACHMPRKNTGLAVQLTRYHRIGSPTDRARVEQDRPLECALCHADKSVEALVGTMERWWNKRYDRAALGALYGDDLGVSPLVAAAMMGKPHEQIVAAAVLGERGPRSAAATLAPLVGSEYPMVRYFARAGIERLLGKAMAIDLDGDPKAIEAQARAFVAREAAR